MKSHSLVVFVCDTPVPDNWIADMQLNTKQVKFIDRTNDNFELEALTMDNLGVRFVALGSLAHIALEELGVNHFHLPHPNSYNLKANSSSWLHSQLEACSKFVLRP